MSSYVTPIPTAQQMAKMLAIFVLQHRNALNSLLAKYGVNIVGLNAMEALRATERMIQRQDGFVDELLATMKERFESMKNFKNADGAPSFDIGGFIGAIFTGTAGIMQGTSSIIDATSDSGKKVRETLAQAELIKAQAMMQNANTNATSRSAPSGGRIVLYVVGGVVLVGGAVGLTVWLVKRGKKKKG